MPSIAREISGLVLAFLFGFAGGLGYAYLLVRELERQIDTSRLLFRQPVDNLLEK